MTIKAHVAYRDGQDGSFSIRICGTRQEALEHLDRTEEQLAEENIYDDGAIEEIELTVDSKGKITKGDFFSVG